MTATPTRPGLSDAPAQHHDVPRAGFHPTLSMVGTLSRCVLLNYRTPAESVERLLPDGLELVRRGPYAFWNVVLCRVDRMRPAGVPEALGVSYHHVAYRLVVQAMTDRCDVRRGLFFVRSDADAALLGAVGNRLSDFRFHRADVTWNGRGSASPGPDAAGVRLERVCVATEDHRADIELTLHDSPPLVQPAESCFPTRDDARRFLTYEPLGLSVGRPGGRRTLKLAEVFRDESAWQEDVIGVADARFGFFEQLGQDDLHLELATRVAPLPYRWRLGRRERLLPTHLATSPPREASPPARESAVA